MSHFTEKNTLLHKPFITMIQSSQILITGGTGLLGKAVCQILDGKSVPYQIATHQMQAPGDSVFMDLRTGEGMDQAVRNKKVILHLASDKKHPDYDVSGTIRLIDSIQKQGLSIHLIYISIVGVEELPMPYFKQKAQVEQIIVQSGLPYSILKATQFHEYVDNALSSFFRFGVGLLPKNILVQPVSVPVVADMMVDLCFGNPTYQIQSIGGPEVLTIEDIVTQWQQARQQSKKYISFSLWGKAGRKLKRGVLTCPKNKKAGENWSSWLQDNYSGKVWKD